MRRFTALSLFWFIFYLPVDAQVRPEYLYNTKMPYGTLDIRTRVSDTRFYYLQEGKTFTFRESAPGVRTYKFLDMTPWDSSPYKEGNLRLKDGSKDSFVMNYRLLPPLNYNSSYDAGYPLIVLMHGAVERGNCYYDDCYHADWTYDPNVNSPRAPTAANHQLLNNDDHLTIGGKKHLDARNLAGGRLPDDRSMPSRAFPGFVLVPQMLNVWDSLVVEDVIRIVRLHCEKYNIDQDRIYIHGLSIGGYATYEAIKRAPWLFAAALPISAVTEAGNIFKHRQQDKVAHLPIWIFQGGKDREPTRAFTEGVISKFRSAGATIKYSLYPSGNHFVWDSAYNEPEFFSWMLSRSKTNLHARAGITHIDTAKNSYPKLMLAEGFFAYQWEKDSTVIENAVSNTLTVREPGVYRARFSRMASPGPNDWNDWSAPVQITGETVPPADEDDDLEDDTEDDDSTEGDDETGGGDANEDGDGTEDGTEDEDNTEGEDGTQGEDDTGGEDGTGDVVDDEDNGDPADPGSGPVTGIEVEDAFGISVYPNPTRGDINIRLSSLKGDALNIELVDMVGHVLYQRKYRAGEFDGGSLNISLPLRDGVYILILRNGEREERRRVLISD